VRVHYAEFQRWDTTTVFAKPVADVIDITSNFLLFEIVSEIETARKTRYNSGKPSREGETAG
jgi:hypothetical protein